MTIIPAIDLQAGRCVRLKQGQFNEVTLFAADPIDRATYFAQLGVKHLHVVDLDGAQTGIMQQLPLISAMQTSGLTVQAGGGIRSLEQAKLCRAAGITKLVIGSIAINKSELCIEIIKEIGSNHIILALDINMIDKIPVPAIHGWQTSTDANLWQVVSFYQAFGISQILCTDIACDGMMQGPNFALYQEAVERFPNMQWQASGGIRHAEDIAQLDSLGVAATILGLSLYQGTLDLAACLQEYASC